MKTLALLSLITATLHAQILIDDFGDGNFSMSGNTVFESHAGSMLGGERRAAIWPYQGAASSALSASVANGLVSVSKSDANSVLLLRYGDFTGNYGGGAERGTHLHLDITGQTGVSVVVSSMTAPFDVHFDFESVSPFERHSTAQVHFDAPGTQRALFNAGVDDSNHADISGIEIMIPTLAASLGTFQIDSLSIIPEPSFYASLFGAGLLAFVAVKRLRKISPQSQTASKRQ